jgi:hypothetical protein
MHEGKTPGRKSIVIINEFAAQPLARVQLDFRSWRPIFVTYIPMARGFVYLAVLLDWATRRVLSWRLSITIEAAFCVETLEDALARHGRRTSSTPTRARSSPARRSPAYSPATPSPSAWTARGPGGTTCSSSGCGAASNTRRCICGRTKPSAKRAARSAVISTSTIDAALIRAMTEAPRIKPTSTRCHSAWQPNQAEAPLIDAEILFRQSGPALNHVLVQCPTIQGRSETCECWP